MITFTATDAKNRFGELLEASHRAPVEIDKQGRPVAVLLSFEAYQELAGGTSTETSFEWLRNWRKNADQTRQKSTSNEDDYHDHLDEKYGR